MRSPGRLRCKLLSVVQAPRSGSKLSSLRLSLFVLLLGCAGLGEGCTVWIANPDVAPLDASDSSVLPDVAPPMDAIPSDGGAG